VEEIKDLLLPQKTINYLIDELYDPFLQAFSAFACFSEEELLNFTLRLEHALNFSNSRHDILKLFEGTLAKPYQKGFFQAVRKISEEMARLRQENLKVLQLEDEEVMIYNLPDFREKTELAKEHILLAQAILNEMAAKNLQLELELANKTLTGLCGKLRREWEEHRDEAEGSVSQSRADDFEPHHDI
jgi:hypothetical protein